MKRYLCVLWTVSILLITSLSLTSCEGIFGDLFPDQGGSDEEDTEIPEEPHGPDIPEFDVELLDKLDPDFMYDYKSHEIELHVRSNSELGIHIEDETILSYKGHEGETYRFELSKNDWEKDRSTKIYFHHPSNRALEVEIRQEMHPCWICNSYNDKKINFREQEITIEIIHSTNTDFSNIEIKADVDWISAPEKIKEEPADEPKIVYSFYKFKIAANPSSEERKGKITFSYPDADRYPSAYITQKGCMESHYKSCSCTYGWDNKELNFSCWTMKLVPEGVCTPEQPEIEFDIYTEYDKVNPNHLSLPTVKLRGLSHHDSMNWKDKLNTFDIRDMKINGSISTSILHGSTMEIFNLGNDEYEIILCLQHYETGEINIYYKGKIEFKDIKRWSQIRKNITWDAKWSDFSVQWIDNKGEAYSSYKMTFDDTKTTGQKLVLYLAVPKQDKTTKTLPQGTYQILENSWSHSLGFWEGFRYYDGGPDVGSWYYDTEKGIAAPIAGGTMTIVNKPNSYCNLKMNFEDDFEAPFTHTMYIQYEGSLKITY